MPASWTPENQVNYPLITGTALAPDGQNVVFTVREALLTDDKSQFINHLYLVPTNGMVSPRQLTFGPHDNSQPKWSPDGATVAFVSTRSGAPNLYALSPFGGEAWALTSFKKGAVTQFEWAPDGQSLGFLRPDLKSEARAEAEKRRDDALVWEEEDSFSHLYRVPFAVGPREPLAVERVTTGRFNITSFNWFPDGSRFVLTHMPATQMDVWPESRLATVPTAPVDETPYDIYALTDVDHIANWGSTVAVSPDGAWIASGKSTETPPRWAFSNRITLFPTAGGDAVPLANVPDEQAWLIGWASDGSGVYASNWESVNSHIWFLPADGSDGTRITSEPLLREWQSLNQKGQFAYAGRNFEALNAIYTFDAATQTEGLLTEPLRPATFAEHAYPSAKVFQWQSTDGLEIEGVLVYPMDYEEGKQYPLIVEVHGGPTGVFSRRSLAGLLRYADTASLAADGYAILRTNPRGSSGYGKQFRFANYDDWGGMDYQDIMTGVDFLIEKGIADPDRLGILGWSYGGYMTSTVITKTNRFKAACVGAGVTNLMSFNGTADIPSFIPDYFSGDAWENLEAYIGHSAMFQIQGAVTPTLIQHGENDIRVPLSQGRELYNALKRQGVPTQLVIYPRQGHGIAEPRLRMDVARRSKAWFDTYLKGG